MARARRQLARYLEEGTSEVPSSPSSLLHPHNAKEVYFDASRDQVALEAPYPIIPSMALPPGHAFAGRQANGTPLLVYRDKKDPTEIRAYVNACRHRGMPLLRPPRNGKFATNPLKSPLLTCPYHAWTYDAQSGDLKKIPGHEKAFGLMDKEAFGLEVMSCQEKAGLVWIGGDLMRENNLWDMDELHTELEPFLFPPHSAPPDAYKVIGYKEWNLQANWQLVVETALESYHVKMLHQKTLNLVTHSTWAMASEWVDQGRNPIMTVPLKTFVPPRDDEDQQDPREFLGQSTTTCLASPSTFVVLLKRFLLVTAIEPSGSSTSRVRSWGLPHPLVDPDEGVDIAERDFSSVIAAVEEDWECVEQIQQGLNGTARTNFIFGGYESNNARFLENVGNYAARLKGLKKE